MQSSARPVADLKGALLHEVTLDARGSELKGPNISSPGAAALRSTEGSQECVVLQPGGSAGAGIGNNHTAPYFAELEIAVQAQSNFLFVWRVRSAQSGSYQIRVDSASATVGRLQFVWLALPAGPGPSPSPVPSVEPLMPAPIALKDWGSGKPVTLAAAVRADSYTIFADGKQVADVKGDHVPAGVSNLLGFTCTTAPGTAKITAMRVYDLKSP